MSFTQRFSAPPSMSFQSYNEPRAGTHRVEVATKQQPLRSGAPAACVPTGYVCDQDNPICCNSADVCCDGECMPSSDC